MKKGVSSVNVYIISGLAIVFIVSALIFLSSPSLTGFAVGQKASSFGSVNWGDVSSGSVLCASFEESCSGAQFGVFKSMSLNIDLVLEGDFPRNSCVQVNSVSENKKKMNCKDMADLVLVNYDILPADECMNYCN